jgi:hypothetical protein
MDSQFIDKLDMDLALKRISADVFSDFIFSPHYSIVFSHAFNELKIELKRQLNSGIYEPKLPVTLEVIKPSGIGRPGAILNPIDRLAYQAIVDTIALKSDTNIDRASVFSNILNKSPQGSMFVSQGQAYNNIKSEIKKFQEKNNTSWILYIDISSFFERIYQHVLINLLRSSKTEPEYISVLEKVLLAFTQKDSHGIIQGVYSSDFLGNYYLIAVDAFLKSKDIKFLRFVDDYWMFFEDENSAKLFLVEIARYIRKEGLSLNESKTKIKPIKDFIFEETEIDRLFESIKNSFIHNVHVQDSTNYGFEPFDIDVIPEDAEFKAIVEVYQKRYKDYNLIEKIDKFCLSYLAKYNSDIALNDVMESIVERPHLMRYYSQYLGSLAKHGNTQVYVRIEKLFLTNKLLYAWQKMWLYNVLLESQSITDKMLNHISRVLHDVKEHESVRAICAIIIGKYGDGAHRRVLRNHYTTEISEYVKDAILYATKYFPSADDRHACITSWRKHSPIRELIAIAILNQIKTP